MITEGIVIALITGSITLIGVLISNNSHDAVIDEKITELTREVRAHNDFATRVPVLEKEIETLKAQADDLKEMIKRTV